VACRPHVQGAPERDDHVRTADQVGRDRGGEATRDVQIAWVTPEQSLGHRRRREQRPARAAELTELASCVPGATSRDEHRLRRGRQDPRQFLHRVVRSSDRLSRRASWDDVGVLASAHADGRGLDVERKVQQDGAALVHRRLDRLHGLRHRL
jgi:hypothetical protein